MLSDALEQLAAQNAQLHKLDELKSDFVSLVSHELRAPLTNLDGGLELVLARGELAPDSREHLTLVQAEVRRLTGFVETILDLWALEAGRLRLEPGAGSSWPTSSNACVPRLSASPLAPV